MGELADRKTAVLLAFVGVAGKVVFDPIALMGLIFTETCWMTRAPGTLHSPRS